MLLSAHFGPDSVCSIIMFEIPGSFSDYVTDAGLKQTATDFLNRKDLRQKLRRELLFGLFPKTLNGKFRTMKYSL